MPKQYTKHDIPTPPDMAEYLARVAAVRGVFIYGMRSNLARGAEGARRGKDRPRAPPP